MTFNEEVYQIVSQIPSGRVITYGWIAYLMGRPNNSRMVGQAMAQTPTDIDIPAHRVVNSQGRTAPGWIEQKELLVSEGIGFRKNGCVDLKKYLWEELD